MGDGLSEFVYAPTRAYLYNAESIVSPPKHDKFFQKNAVKRAHA